MRQGKLNETEAVAIVGEDAVDKVGREDCDYTGRCMEQHETVVEFSASVSAINTEGDEVTLVAYYYPDQSELDAAGEDLSSVDWEIAGYEIV